MKSGGSAIKFKRWFSHRNCFSLCLLCGILSVLQLASLLSKSHYCLVSDAQNRIDELCHNLNPNKVEGIFGNSENDSLCDLMCKNGKTQIQVTQCLGMHFSKEMVFSATINTTNLEVIIKSAGKARLSGLDYHNYYKREQLPVEDPKFWLDNRGFKEHFIQVTYAKEKLFPRSLGACGDYFASQRAPPVDLLSFNELFWDVQKTWKKRLKIAIELVRLAQRLDTAELVYCDVKPDHFGWAIPYDEDVGDHLIILDADHVFRKPIIDAILSNITTPCSTDEQCSKHDCRTNCNTINGTCSSHGMVNSNLQIICHNVFLGKYRGAFVNYPGLIFSKYAKDSLTQAVLKCAKMMNKDEIEISSATQLLMEELNLALEEDTASL